MNSDNINNTNDIATHSTAANKQEPPKNNKRHTGRNRNVQYKNTAEPDKLYRTTSFPKLGGKTIAQLNKWFKRAFRDKDAHLMRYIGEEIFKRTTYKQFLQATNNAISAEVQKTIPTSD